MALSEEEKRVLKQMELALVDEDPKFASTLRGTELRRAARKRAIVAGLVFVGGIALLMTGAISRIALIGIAGFAIMLASAIVALTAIRGRVVVDEVATDGADEFLSAEERWRHRHGDE